MSEIGEGQSYLDVDRRIVRNRVTVNYLGLCGVKLSRLHGQKNSFLRLRSARSGCSAAPPSASKPRQYSRRHTGVANERECGKMPTGSKGRPR
jgi:hypothetical protein